MYTISILWYLACPVLITVTTIIILYAVKQFDFKNQKRTES
ncbi:MAG: hypothetical protein ABIJ04_00575 [Bacteroidota bacterium]